MRTPRLYRTTSRRQHRTRTRPRTNDRRGGSTKRVARNADALASRGFRTILESTTYVGLTRLRPLPSFDGVGKRVGSFSGVQLSNKLRNSKRTELDRQTRCSGGMGSSR